MVRRRRTLSAEDANRIIQTAIFRSDRETAIVAGAHLEELLEAAIKARLVEMPQTGDNAKHVTEAALFDGYGPLATFYAKIDVGFALGLYQQDARADLHIIRSIRNEFAHAVESFSFSEKQIESKCKKLHAKFNETDIKGSPLELIPQELAQNFLTKLLFLLRVSQIDGHLTAISETPLRPQLHAIRRYGPA